MDEAAVLDKVFGIPQPQDADALLRELLAHRREGTTRQDEVDACGMLEWLYCACFRHRPPDAGYLFALKMRRGRGGDPAPRFVLFVVALLLAATEPVDLEATTPIVLDGPKVLLLHAKVHNTVLDVCPHPWNDYIPDAEPALHGLEPDRLFFLNAGRATGTPFASTASWAARSAHDRSTLCKSPIWMARPDGGEAAAAETADRLLVGLAEALGKHALDAGTDAAVREFLFRVGCTGSLRSALDGPFARRLAKLPAARAFCEAVAALALPYGPFGALPRWAIDEFTEARLNGRMVVADASDAALPEAVQVYRWTM